MFLHKVDVILDYLRGYPPHVWKPPNMRLYMTHFPRYEKDISCHQ